MHPLNSTWSHLEPVSPSLSYQYRWTFIRLDTREMARSLGKLNEDDLRWIGSERTGSHERIARAGSGSVLPESIPEEGGDTSGKDRRDGDTKQAERMERIRKLRDRDSKFYTCDTGTETLKYTLSSLILKKVKCFGVSSFQRNIVPLSTVVLYSLCDDDTDRTINTDLLNSCCINIAAKLYSEQNYD